MPNAALKEHLEAAFMELRNDMELARANGERAHRALNLNGAKPKLPPGLVSAIEEVRRLYAQANETAERVLVEQLGGSREMLKHKLDMENALFEERPAGEAPDTEAEA